jgi:Polyketide cyclase / dehydrase and lipid transport
MVLADLVSHQSRVVSAPAEPVPPGPAELLAAPRWCRADADRFGSNRAHRCYVPSCDRYDGSAAGKVQLGRRVEAGSMPQVTDVKSAMTFRTESRITIASSVSEAFAYICDVGRWPEWAPTVLEGRVRGGTPLQPGSRVDQRAKGILGLTRGRSQEVTVVEAPRYVAFAGPMGTSAARWGMELEPVDDRQTDAKMWIEVDLAGIMRAVPGILKRRIQRVSDLEMVAIKAAVESATRAGAES